MTSANDTTHVDEDVALIDLVAAHVVRHNQVPEFVLRGHDFTRCLVRGPIVIRPIGGLTLNNVTHRLPPDIRPGEGLDAIFWEAPEARGLPVGALFVEDCRFDDCVLEDIGIAGPPELRAQLAEHGVDPYEGTERPARAPIDHSDPEGEFPWRGWPESWQKPERFLDASNVILPLGRLSPHDTLKIAPNGPKAKIFENKWIDHSRFLGPAIIVLEPPYFIRDAKIQFPPRAAGPEVGLDGAFWDVAHGQAKVGEIRVRECFLDDCLFYNVGLAGPPAVRDYLASRVTEFVSA